MSTHICIYMCVRYRKLCEKETLLCGGRITLWGCRKNAHKWIADAQRKVCLSE